MNDCFWCMICVCDGEECGKCGKYVSTNDEEGEELCRVYGNAIDEAIEPIRKEIAKQHGFFGGKEDGK